MTKIIGIGNALVDVLVHLEDESLLRELRLPKGGMTLIDSEHLGAINAAIAPFHSVRATGGSASNTIHALALLGNKVGFIGAIGNDEPGRFFRKQAELRGVDVHLSTVSGMASGVATTFITPDGERTFATHLGAATQIALEDQSLAAGGILHVEGYLVQNHTFVEAAMRRAKEAGLLVSYDLASWNIVAADRGFIHHLVAEYADIVFANQEEAATFCQQQEPEEALRQLAALTQVAVVKVGKRGAFGCAKGEFAFAPGRPVKVTDTTAAGDFFAAGFLHGWVHGQPLEECLTAGNRIAGEVVQVMGTQVDADRLRAAIAV